MVRGSHPGTRRWRSEQRPGRADGEESGNHPWALLSAEQMVEADFDPPIDARNLSRTGVAVAGVHDVAQRLQALGEKPRALNDPHHNRSTGDAIQYP
jgi:hypothetical protein